MISHIHIKQKKILVRVRHTRISHTNMAYSYNPKKSVSKNKGHPYGASSSSFFPSIFLHPSEPYGLALTVWLFFNTYGVTSQDIFTNLWVNFNICGVDVLISQ